jgi:anti-sigma factor RsiW
MNCREFTDFLDDYLSGAQPAGERAEFEKHLALCPQCVAYLDSYRKTVQLGKASCADDSPPADAPDELIQAILRARSRKG